MACRIQVILGKITKHCGFWDGSPAGSCLVGDEVRVIDNFFRSGGQLWGLLWHLSVWLHGKIVRGSFYFRVQELKLNFGQGAVFRLPDGQTLRPLVRSRLLSSAASRVADFPGERLDLRGVYREKNMISRVGFKDKLKQSHKEPLFQLFTSFPQHLHKMYYWFLLPHFQFSLP